MNEFRVQLIKTQDQSWGLELNFNGSPCPKIVKITANSPADNSALQIGDVILSINGRNLRTLSPADTLGILRSSCSIDIYFERVRTPVSVIDLLDDNVRPVSNTTTRQPSNPPNHVGRREIIDLISDSDSDESFQPMNQNHQSARSPTSNQASQSSATSTSSIFSCQPQRAPQLMVPTISPSPSRPVMRSLPVNAPLQRGVSPQQPMRQVASQPPRVPQPVPTSSSGKLPENTPSSGKKSGVRIKLEFEPKGFGEADVGDEVVEIRDPSAAAKAAEKGMDVVSSASGAAASNKRKFDTMSRSSGGGGDSDDDIEFVGGTMTTASDMPHQREACTQHKFVLPVALQPPQTRPRSISPDYYKRNEVYCAQCYCYVCEIRASECKDWVEHCNATYKDGKWKAERQSRNTKFILLMAPELRSSFYAQNKQFLATCRNASLGIRSYFINDNANVQRAVTSHASAAAKNASPMVVSTTEIIKEKLYGSSLTEATAYQRFLEASELLSKLAIAQIVAKYDVELVTAVFFAWLFHRRNTKELRAHFRDEVRQHWEYSNTTLRGLLKFLHVQDLAYHWFYHPQASGVVGMTMAADLLYDLAEPSFEPVISEFMRVGRFDLLSSIIAAKKENKQFRFKILCCYLEHLNEASYQRACDLVVPMEESAVNAMIASNAAKFESLPAVKLAAFIAIMIRNAFRAEAAISNTLRIIARLIQWAATARVKGQVNGDQMDSEVAALLEEATKGGLDLFGMACKHAAARPVLSDSAGMSWLVLLTAMLLMMTAKADTAAVPVLLRQILDTLFQSTRGFEELGRCLGDVLMGHSALFTFWRAYGKFLFTELLQKFYLEAKGSLQSPALQRWKHFSKIAAEWESLPKIIPAAATAATGDVTSYTLMYGTPAHLLTVTAKPQSPNHLLAQFFDSQALLVSKGVDSTVFGGYLAVGVGNNFAEEVTTQALSLFSVVQRHRAEFRVQWKGFLVTAYRLLFNSSRPQERDAARSTLHAMLRGNASLFAALFGADDVKYVQNAFNCVHTQLAKKGSADATPEVSALAVNLALLGLLHHYVSGAAVVECLRAITRILRLASEDSTSLFLEAHLLDFMQGERRGCAAWNYFWKLLLQTIRDWPSAEFQRSFLLENWKSIFSSMLPWIDKLQTLSEEDIFSAASNPEGGFEQFLRFFTAAMQEDAKASVPAVATQISRMEIDKYGALSALLALVRRMPVSVIAAIAQKRVPLFAAVLRQRALEHPDDVDGLLALDHTRALYRTTESSAHPPQSYCPVAISACPRWRSLWWTPTYRRPCNNRSYNNHHRFRRWRRCRSTNRGCCST